MVPILCNVLFLVTGWFLDCTLGSLTGCFAFFVGTLGALFGGCCCCCFLVVLRRFTLATATVCPKASWSALSVTLDDCESRNGNGDFSDAS